MPIYEYRRADGTTFEVIQKFSDEALTKDPETGEPVERVYHSPAIHFKGPGFHNTDYGTRRRGKTDTDSGAGSHETSTKREQSDGAKSGKTSGDSKSSSSSSGAAA